MKLIRIHPHDNVAVALGDLKAGEEFSVDALNVTAAEDIARGHKIALLPIPEGEAVIKYGNPIGLAKTDIPAGAWVHVHNVRTGLSESADYAYCHKSYPLPTPAPRSFRGYRRSDGRAAVRNELWIIPTVGCVNSVSRGASTGCTPSPTPTAAARWATTMPRPASCLPRLCAIPTRAACWC